MKYLLTIYGLLIVALAGAQTTISHVISNVDGEELKIRWIPENAESLQSIIHLGVEVELFPVLQDGEYLSESIQNAEKSIFILSVADSSVLDTSSYYRAEAVRKLIYLPSDILMPDDQSLVSIIKNRNIRQGQFSFYLMQAMSDMTSSEFMAIGDVFTIDTSYDAYQIRVRIDDGSSSFADHYVDLNADQVDHGIILEKVKSGVDKAVITWNTSQADGSVTMFQIERQSGNGHWQRLHEDSWFRDFSAVDKGYYSIVDSVSHDLPDLKYRVRGISIWEKYTDWETSEIVNIKAPRKDIFTNLDSIHRINGTMSSIHSSFLDYQDIVSVEIQYSEKQAGPYSTMFATGPVDSTHIVNLALPGSFGYVRTVAKDANDYEYPSNVSMYAHPDEVAPLAPTGLGAALVGRTVTLFWENNAESDIEGYRVFMNNFNGNEFIAIDGGIVRNNKHVYTIDLDVEIDSAFFYITALDYFMNESIPSDVISLARPDLFPPTKPILNELLATETGVNMGWINSEDDDIAYIHIERMQVEDDEFQVIHTFDVLDNPLWSDSIVSFIDSTYTSPDIIKYRVCLEDDAENKTCSEYLNVYPYINLLHGPIDHLEVEFVCIVSPEAPEYQLYDWINSLIIKWEENGELNQELLDLILAHPYIDDAIVAEVLRLGPAMAIAYFNQQKLIIWEDYISIGIELDWQYALDDEVLEYYVFRGVNNSGLVHYSTLQKDELEPPMQFFDKDVDGGSRYIYRIVAQHIRGGFTQPSESASVTTN